MSSKLRNKLFICYRVDDVADNQERCLNFIDKPKDPTDWELNFLQTVTTRKPAQLTVECSGALSDCEAVTDLLSWVDENSLELPTNIMENLCSLSQADFCEDNDNSYYQEEDIAQIFNDSFATESLAALEGPFDALKQKISETVAKNQIKGINANTKATESKINLDDIMTKSLAEIRASMAAAKLGKVLPIGSIQPAQVVMGLIQSISDKDFKMPPCYALIQNKRSDRDTLDINEILTKNNATLLTKLKAQIAELSEATDEATKTQYTKDITITQATLVSAVTKAIKDKLTHIGNGASVLGYTNKEEIKKGWGTDAIGDKASALSWGKPEVWSYAKAAEFDALWKRLGSDVAKRDKMVDILFPKGIVAAAKTAKAAFKSMEKPFTSLAWRLLAQQASKRINPLDSAIAYLLHPSQKNTFEKIFQEFGDSPFTGLNLSLSTTVSSPTNTEAPKEVTQLNFIYSLYDKRGDLKELRKGSEWKGIETMKTSFVNAFKEGKNRVFTSQQRGINSQTELSASQIRSAWKIFDPAGYDKVRTEKDSSIIQLYAKLIDNQKNK